MTEKLQPLRGMKDLFCEDFALHNHIINIAQKISNLYCYEGASTPIVEYTRVFDRTLGETSDVVSKEMYSFLDRNNQYFYYTFFWSWKYISSPIWSTNIDDSISNAFFNWTHI